MNSHLRFSRNFANVERLDRPNIYKKKDKVFSSLRQIYCYCRNTVLIDSSNRDKDVRPGSVIVNVYVNTLLELFD